MSKDGSPSVFTHGLPQGLDSLPRLDVNYLDILQAE